MRTFALTLTLLEGIVGNVKNSHPHEAAVVARRALPRYRGAYTEAVATPDPEWPAELDVLRTKISFLETIANASSSPP